MLLEPLRDATLVEEVPTRHFSRFLSEILAANGAAGVFFVVGVIAMLAVLVCYLYLGQVFDCGFSGWRGTSSSHLLF